MSGVVFLRKGGPQPRRNARLCRIMAKTVQDLIMKAPTTAACIVIRCGVVVKRALMPG